MEEKSFYERMKDIFKHQLGYVAVALVSCAYIATAFVSVGTTGKSIGEIIADGVVAFLLGIMLNRMFEGQGMMNGDRDGRVIDVCRRHAASVERIASRMDLLDDWCERKNAEALSRARRQYLSRHGLRYGEYFYSDGTPRPYAAVRCKQLKYKCRELLRRWHFRRACHLKLTRLSAGLLISDSGNPNDPYFLGRSKQEYTAVSARNDIWSKLIVAALFGYYGVSMIQSFSYADLIWTLLQLAIFLLMGVVKMNQSYLFVTDEYRGRVSKKCDILQMFENDMTKETMEKEETDGNTERKNEG